MTLRASLVAYPWDLLDEGLESVLDRLQGEIGITGIAVWGASPPVTQLRVRSVEPRLFRTRGGVFFHPDEQYYAGTRCKPVASSWVKTRNPLARITEACCDRALDLRAIVSAAQTGRLAQRHPEMACKNVYGAESYLAVCLANPDVQAYICGLIEDLSANYKLAGVSVADMILAWHEATTVDFYVAWSMGEIERKLLATCFCESCYQRATACGVDVEGARRSVQVMLQRSLDRGEAATVQLDAVLADDVPLADYYRWRAEEVAALFARLAGACKCGLFLDRNLTEPDQLQYQRIDLAGAAGVITSVERADQLASALCRDAQRNELRVPASLVIEQRGADLVSSLSQAAELGFVRVEIDNYGRLPDAALTTVKQAVRFARRITSD